MSGWTKPGGGAVTAGAVTVAALAIPTRAPRCGATNDGAGVGSKNPAGVGRRVKPRNAIPTSEHEDEDPAAPQQAPAVPLEEGRAPWRRDGGSVACARLAGVGRRGGVVKVGLVDVKSDRAMASLPDRPRTRPGARPSDVEAHGLVQPCARGRRAQPAIRARARARRAATARTPGPASSASGIAGNGQRREPERQAPRGRLALEDERDREDRVGQEGHDDHALQGDRARRCACRRHSRATGPHRRGSGTRRPGTGRRPRACRDTETTGALCGTGRNVAQPGLDARGRGSLLSLNRFI